MPYKDTEVRKEYAKRYYAVYNKTEKQRRWLAEYKRKVRQADPAKAKQYVEAWKAANPERLKQYRRRAYEKIMADPVKRERKRQAGQRYRERNPEKVRLMWRRWKTKDPEYAKLLDRISHSKRYNAPGTCSPTQWEARFAFYGYTCAYCHTDLTNAKYEIDHVIPIKKGGTNWASNFVPACQSCNRKKHCNRWNPRPVAVKETLNG